MSKFIHVVLKVRPEFKRDAKRIVEAIEPTTKYPIVGERILRLAELQLDHMERAKGYMQNLRDKRKKARGAI